MGLYNRFMQSLFQAEAAVTGVLAQVALERSVDVSSTGLTYAVPASLKDLSVGQRVIVPLGRGDKPVTGYVIKLHEAAEQSEFAGKKNKTCRIKTILSRDAQGLSLPADLIELARWIGAYYCCPLGMVLLSMLPAAVKKGTGSVSSVWVSLPEVSSESSESSEQTGTTKSATVKLSALQKKALELLRESVAAGEQWVELKRLSDRAGARSIGPVKQLVARGLLRSQERSGVRAAWDEGSPQEADGIAAAAASMVTNSAAASAAEPAIDRVELSQSQRGAVEAIGARLSAGFSVNLLHGVTGSGKTEVYLRLIEQLLQREPGAGVIVLVPEIALTPQTVSRFVGRFSGVAVLHSGLTASQRHEQWRRIREGRARIVVGARSAIFAPLASLGLIIVDEEHESSYKQDQLPRYHARDVAIKRAQSLGATVVLGSATPSLESYWNAVHVGSSTSSSANRPTQPRYHLHSLPDRVPGVSLPRVEIVDLSKERSKRAGVHLLSVRLEELLTQTLRDKGQAMLLLNRRGYANYIACPDARCGWMMRCDYCDATMVYHKDGALPTGGLLKCHHCQAQQVLPGKCPSCSRHVTVFGLGTQRVEEEIARKFPRATFLRMDSDTMRSARDYHTSLQAFGRGEVDMLVGTQMIAKGLDFPNVQLVGVISGDTALHMPDFRAAERTFQLIAQVAGRAGRGDKAGTVVVQTFNPDDPSILLASKHDFESFAAREMKLRAEVGLPPATRMARIVCRDTDLVKCVASATELASHLNSANERLGGNVRVRGPMPCPIARVADFHRQQIELIAPDAATLQKLLADLRRAALVRSDAHTAVDVDPVTMI